MCNQLEINRVAFSPSSGVTHSCELQWGREAVRESLEIEQQEAEGNTSTEGLRESDAEGRQE